MGKEGGRGSAARACRTLLLWAAGGQAGSGALSMAGVCGSCPPRLVGLRAGWLSTCLPPPPPPHPQTPPEPPDQQLALVIHRHAVGRPHQRILRFKLFDVGHLHTGAER